MPHTVWLAAPRALRTPVTTQTSFPRWALDRAMAEYAPPGATVLLTAGPATDPDHIVYPRALTPGWPHYAESAPAPGQIAAASVDLALVLDDPPEHGERTAHHAPGFYQALHTALRPRGVLLVHTHTRHTTGGLHDPAALILPAAHTAGFGYLQHLILVHQRLDTPTPTRPRCAESASGPAPPVCRRIHTDLYALTARAAPPEARTA